MIRQPARLAALQFETEAKSGQTLDDRLADDAAKFPENLPLLEFVLDALYQSRTDKRLLTHEAYDKLGGLEGAIAKKANDVWTSLGAPEQTANDVFASLVQIAATTAGAQIRGRRRVAAGSPRRSSSTLVAARFVSAGDAGISTVSLAHETLIEHFAVEGVGQRQSRAAAPGLAPTPRRHSGRRRNTRPICSSTGVSLTKR
jgi:hypothetical protein